MPATMVASSSIPRMMPVSSSAAALSVPGSAVQRSPSAPALNVDLWRREMETAQKEVLKLKAFEKGLLWDMTREDQRAKETAKAEEQLDLMHWRWEQVEAAREAAEQKEREDRSRELEENLEATEFKRSVRVAAAEEERRLHAEAYADGVEQNAWEEQVVQEHAEHEHRLLEERTAEEKDFKRVKQLSKLRVKEEQEQREIQDQALQMDFERRKIFAELEALRKSAQFVQNAASRPRVR